MGHEPLPLHLGALPETIVWDREGAIHDGRGTPARTSPRSAGAWRSAGGSLQARDPESKGALERTHRFMRTSFEPARSFANPLDFQDQLDRWFTGRANPRFHRGIRAVPGERLIEERKRMRALPEPMPQTALRSVLRVPQQPYFRFDTSRIKAARFPSRKTLEEFDFTFQRSVKKQVIEHLGQLDFLHAKENVVLLSRRRRDDRPPRPPRRDPLAQGRQLPPARQGPRAPTPTPLSDGRPLRYALRAPLHGRPTTHKGG